MPIGTNALELQGFYSNGDLFKTIQKSYKFFATFWDDSMIESAANNSNPGSAFYNELGSMPVINHWHVKSLVLPQYPFGKDVIKYGPIAKCFPTMTDFNGLDIEVEFEEDEYGTIAYFINYLQRKIVRSDGTFRSQLENRIQNFVILTEDDLGVPINIYWYKNVFLQNATPLTLDYSSNESIKYVLTFGCDLVKFLPIKALAKEKIKNEVVASILGV